MRTRGLVVLWIAAAVWEAAFFGLAVRAEAPRGGPAVVARGLEWLLGVITLTLPGAVLGGTLLWCAKRYRSGPTRDRREH
jgi:hypothetical protein